MTETNPFAGGLLTLFLVPTERSLEECAEVLQAHGLRAWTEQLPQPSGESVVVAAVPCERAPSTDDIGDLRRLVVAVLDAQGLDADVRGSGFTGAHALQS
ncbi:hypothetical protein [Kineococcus indalonis]|uniref:hypothetical protein n=1 Tax=Kineococcus indalonis TaxID=2696566 RepID=UPI001412ABEB|nr:hypothetical protein [Kineococcus indalonis]NAZ88705.1 hypothetical protein [Kineococcus indalonis]